MRIPLTVIDEAPPEVPELVVNGVGVEPTQYQWLADGAWDYRTVDDPGLLRPDLVPAGGALTYEFSSGVRPEMVTLYEFTDLGDDGLPGGTAANTLDCYESARCTVELGSDRAVVTLRDPIPGAIATIVAVYERSTGDPERPAVLLSASWVVRIT